MPIPQAPSPEKSGDKSPHSKTAFTLIELLVVVTIIVALLALLVPAMDKAIYQAELAVCAAGQSAIAKSVNIYAFDFKRTYPYRELVGGGGESARPWLLRIGDQGPAGAKASARDDRRPLKGYMDMKLLVDPLCEQVDLNDPVSWIYSSYALWFGWNYTGRQGMTKVGNRLTWVDGSDATPRTYAMNWLVTDADNPNPANNGGWYQGSHPDELGLLQNQAIQGGAKDSSVQSQANSQVGGTETNSKWFSSLGVWDRGEIEMNAASADGAVVRFNDVRTYDDERMSYAPLSPGQTPAFSSYPARSGSAAVPDAWINIPIR